MPVIQNCKTVFLCTALQSAFDIYVKQPIQISLNLASVI